MSPWSFFRDDRFVLAGIGVAGIGTVVLMVSMLHTVMEDNIVEPSQPKTQYITQETEDSLPLDTLDKLLSHPNYSIKEVAVKILCDRALNDADTIHYLLYGITQADYDHRMQCLKALALLISQNIDSLNRLHTPKAYAAFVRSLEVGFDDSEYPKLNDNYWDEYHLRDMAERFCLTFIYELIMKYGPDLLIRAKFVERWLAKQNWGDNEEEIQHNFKEYRRRKKNNRIKQIIDIIRSCRSGRATLRRAKLVPKKEPASGGGTPDPDDFSRVLRVTLEVASAEEEQPFNLRTRVRRTVERSAEEQRLRRQHREAMVFNDGTRPVGREDIIEREREA